MSLEALKTYVKKQQQEDNKKAVEVKIDPKNKILTAHMERDKQLWVNNKKQAENIRRSEVLRIKINKGVQQGQDVFMLLLDAIECISLMTSDEMFYKQNINKLKERE